MTKELFEKLSKYEEKLHTAFYCDFVRLTDPSMKRDLAQLHKELFGTEGNIMNGCNRCVLTALKNIAREYYRFQKQLEAEEAKKAEEVREEPEPVVEVVDIEEVIEQPKKTATNKTKKTTKKK